MVPVDLHLRLWHHQHQVKHLASRACLRRKKGKVAGDFPEVSSCCSHFPLDFLVDYQNTGTPDVPYSVWDNTTYLGQKLLKDAHSRLIEYHAVNKSINFPPEIVNALPTQAIVALWVCP